MLEVDDICFSYDEELVLDELSISFQAKEVHGILGPNGAGKTTLFELIFGIHSLQSGTIKLDNQPLHITPIGYLETENYFYPYMKGREYLDLLTHANPDFNIHLWNNIFKLPLDDMIDTYSRGMKKKLALLGILSLDRPVLLLDEPFNGLDLETVENFSQILKKLKKSDKVIVISSHILPALKQNCDRISFLHRGKIQDTFKKADFGQIDEIIKTNLMRDSESALNEIFKD